MENLLEGALTAQYGQISEAVRGIRHGAAGIGAVVDLERDSAGQIRPRYEFVQRPAGRLACTELVLEPMLGPVRVAGIAAGNGGPAEFVHVAWSDDYGPCRAAGRYPADRLFPVRIPHQADRLLIRQGIDQAAWKRREISAAIARLIAAHLHLGPGSALYGFAVRGTVPEQLYDELERVSTVRPAYRQWADALTRCCVSRTNSGPMPGWGPDPPAAEWDAMPDAGAGTAVGREQRRAHRQAGPGWPLRTKRMSTETAMQLIDAAFALGLEAGRSRARTPRPRRLLRNPATT